MNILFLSRLYYPHIGGVEKHVFEIGKILRKEGHRVTVLTEKYDKRLLGSEVKDDINIIRIDSGGDGWFKKFVIWREVWKNRNLIKKADIVHAHDVFFWYLPFRFSFPSRKVFTTFHGYEGNKIPGIKSKLMHKIAEKLSYGNICVGDVLEKWYGTKPDFVIYGGTQIPNPKFLIPNKFKIKNKKYKILFLGRLEEETGIMVYLEALKKLNGEGVRFELTILGDGELRKETEVFVKKYKISAAFKGFVKTIEPFIKSSDIVFASRYLGVLEALSFKKPAFAVYNNKIKKDYLVMTPFSKSIFISGNAGELSSQIKSLLKNGRVPDVQIENFTWKNVAKTYLKLWQEK